MRLRRHAEMANRDQVIAFRIGKQDRVQALLVRARSLFDLALDPDHSDEGIAKWQRVGSKHSAPNDLRALTTLLGRELG